MVCRVSSLGKITRIYFLALSPRHRLCVRVTMCGHANHGAFVQADLYFVVPGDLNTRTGGYAYDRRVLQELSALGLHIEILRLSARFPYPDAAALQDAEQQLAQLPDASLVMLDGLAFGAMASIANKHRTRLRLIALCHHPLALESGLSAAQAAAFKHSERSALACARAVIVTSPHTGRMLEELFALPPSKIHTALPGTDRAPFAPCTGQPPVLLTVATLTPRKAHDVLIAALARIKHLPWQARFIGGAEFDPDWSAGLQQQVRNAGLDERIAFLGSLASLEQEYLAADLFVLASLYEGYGMVFAEALAHGLPIVAARAGAVADVVPSTAGLLVSPSDPVALADALYKVLRDNSLHKRLQYAAQRSATLLPSWQSTAQGIYRVMANTALEE